MTTQIIFFHGGAAKEDYDADARLVTSLKTALGPGYNVSYPFLPKMEVPDLGRREQISNEISRGENTVILVAHSLGASMLLATLSGQKITKDIAGVFLISTPFWKGDEDWVKGFKLKQNFADKLDKNTPLFFYHAHDDEEVEISHMETYKEKLPWATYREIKSGGHQLGNDLSVVAADIKSLKR